MKDIKGVSYLENSIIGLIEIIEEKDGISSISFLRNKDLIRNTIIYKIFEENNEKFDGNFKSKKLLKFESFITKECRKQLEEYFLGKRKIFDIKLDMKGTEFQKLAWEKLIEIPYGQTASYQEQAIKMKNPKAVRAVGGANGKNSIPIIIPCHRVIGKNGKLIGYSGGEGGNDGISIKKYLLELEEKYK